MNFLLDFSPIIAFFAVYQVAAHHAEWIPQALLGLLPVTPGESTFPVIWATAVAILATFIQLAIYLICKKKIEPTFWLSLVVIVIFGSLTIYFNNGLFIQWKPSILYWLMAGILIFARLTHRNFAKTIMSKGEISMSEKAWRQLQDMWIVLLTLFGVINLAVVYTTSMDTWVNFKLYGLFALTIVFTIVTVIFVTKQGSHIHND